MSRVSEGSTIHAVNYSIAKTKKKLEDLQLQGSNLKRVQNPSDDPIGNMEILSIRSKKIDGNQYLRNASVAKAQLSFTENAIEDLTEIMVKAKELAIGQSSNIFDVSIRRSVAKEVGQIYNQAIGIGNRRLGNKYIFAGHKTLTKPFDENGNYKGDEKQTKIEIGKDVFIPITFNGKDIFFEKTNSTMTAKSPLENSPFENLEDILKHITDEGLDELNFKKMNVELLDKEEGRTKGLVLTLTNRKNNSFKVIVCVDNETLQSSLQINETPCSTLLN